MKCMFLGLILSLVPLSACATGKKVRVDPVTESTVLAGDASAIIVGCDNNPAVGFAYCRKSEGETAGQSISFVGPPSKCNQKDSCVYFKVWSNTGQLVWGGSIPKGETRTSVSWKQLLSSDTFELGNRGFWTVNETVYWIDPDGRERTSVAQADIVLRVYKKGYLPLNNIKDDPSFVWVWSEGGFIYKMTSALRSFVGQAP